MGIQYRPIRVVAKNNWKTVVGIIDTGADETVISPELADILGCKQMDEFKAVSISGHEIIGKYTIVDMIKDEWHNKSVKDYLVGVIADPFMEAGDEGIHIIIGVDFLQDTNYEMKFSNE